MASEGKSELVWEANGELVLHPNPRRLGAWFIGSILAGIPLVLVFVLRGLLELPWGGAVLIVAGGVALGAASFWLRLRSETVRLTPTGLVVTTSWGLRRTIPRSSIARIVFATVRTTIQPLAFMLFVGDGGRCLSRTAVDGISRESLATFAGQFDLPSTALENEVSFGQLRRQFPGSTSWVSAHPVATALMVTPLIVVAVTGYFISQSIVADKPAHLGEARPLFCSGPCGGGRTAPEIGTLTVIKVVDPAQATAAATPPVPNGSRLVGVEVRWQGMGSVTPSSDPAAEIVVLDTAEASTSPAPATSEVPMPAPTPSPQGRPCPPAAARRRDTWSSCFPTRPRWPRSSTRPRAPTCPRKPLTAS